jgi:hypothetical protein
MASLHDASAGSNDYHVLPATDKQLSFAQSIASRGQVDLPLDVRSDRRRLSRWIDENKRRATSRFSDYPSSKQVAFAERIARLKRRQVPPECFRDRTLMSKWIDGNI